jgi:hypothetical protein
LLRRAFDRKRDAGARRDRHVGRDINRPCRELQLQHRVIECRNDNPGKHIAELQLRLRRRGGAGDESGERR